MASWRDVRRLALSFPATKEITSHERAAWTVGDKFFIWERPLRRSDLVALGERAPDGPILGVRTADLEMKEVLLASNPRVYFTTP
ncbi:MAG: MmcQ/YjbR family DNA-binding protein, partial [Candidatus Eremiobacteraeota bacterium]|nr:MmcQ/YjbR family DNA-binding protein [Candidatus Eremiobacteraeota bacterium]